MSASLQTFIPYKVYLYTVKSIIHINQHNIRSNATKGTDKPVITVKTYKSNTYAKEVIIYGQDGLECARVVYSPDKPLSCGARVWIETTCKVSALPCEEACKDIP